MRRRLAAVVVMMAMLALGATALRAEEKTMTPLDIPKIGDMEALKVGDAAPLFDAKEAGGARYTFDPAAPGAKILVFWSIFCEPCREEMPLVQSIYEKNKANGLRVVTIALDGNLEENIRQFVKQGKFTFTVLLDEESQDGSLVLAEKFMVPGTPTVYVVDPKGKITYSHVGRTSETELNKAVTEAMGR